MATLVKQFVNHFGLDLKSNDINRESVFATGTNNARYKKNGNIGKREGFRGAAETAGGYGLHLYERISSGLTINETVTIDDNLFKLNDATFAITYSGLELSVVYELFFDEDTDVYRVTIVEGTVEVLNFSLGVGFDEGSPITLADLKVAVDAITDFTSTITGVTTTPAAFLDFVRNSNLANGDVTTTARYWTQVNSTVTDPFAPFFATRADDNFENVTFEQLNNTLFIAGKDIELHKFDGQTVYRASLPKPDAPTTAIGVAGVLTSATGYVHRLRYTQIDNNGILIDGTPSTGSTALVVAADSIDVTVDNIVAGSGFNTNCGIIAGVQVSVTTLSVDDGAGGQHTLQAGDTAYFFDSITGGFITRSITSIGALSITIGGAAVTVADNDVISNNLRIGIYRNLDGGTFSFLVAEIPNDSFAATQVFNDNVADLSLGIQLIEPIFPGTLPPSGKYVSKFNAQLCIAGDEDNPSIFFFSFPNEPELWSTGLLNLQIGELISGIGQDNEVMAVFENSVTHIVSGDLPNLNVRVDVVNQDIGCVSHHSIQEVRGSLYFLSDRGVFKMTSGQQPLNISELIEPLFDIDITLPSDQRPVLNRAIGVNHRDKEQYILYIPSETVRGSDVESNDNSTIIVQDYFRNAWLTWDNMNMAGGAIIVEDQLFFVERRFSIFTADVEHILFLEQNRGDNWDFQDNTAPIDWEYDTAWYHFGEPSIFKKYLRLKVFGIEDTDNNAFSIDVSIERDFIQDLIVGNFNIDFAATADGYGISPYGISPYGDVFDPNRKEKIGPLKAKAIRFLMTNESDKENVDISGWEIELAQAYRSELKE